MDDTCRSTWQLPAGELAGSVLAVIERQRYTHAQLLEQIAEVERRGIAGELGFRTTVRWLVTAFRLSTAQAREWVAQAKALYPTGSVTGGEHPGRFPRIAASLQAGRISDSHVRVLRETLTRAAKKPPSDTERDNDLADPQREFHSHYDRHGWLRFHGRLDPETAALLEGAFRELAAPAPAHNGLPDIRTPERRRGDALAEIIGLAARTDDMPVRNGEHALITITATTAEIESDTAPLFVDGPGFLTSAAIKRMCCGASRMVGALLGAQGELLHLGRAVRNATPAQRRALALRDRGCTFPGCTHSPKWCVPHHVQHWEHHGPTDLDNLALLCESHHRLVHHAGWTITMTTGTPHFTAPHWLDPTRTPRRNTAHDPPPPQRSDHPQPSFDPWTRDRVPCG